MFGIGYQEMMIILVVALVVFGPHRLPELAGQVGRWVREFRRMTADLTEEFEKTVAEADDIKRSITGEVTGMRSQVKSVSNSVKKDLQGTAKSGSAASAKRSASVAGKKMGGTATAGSGAVKKPSVATAAKAKPPVPAAPMATKADPLADVSFLDDEPAMPSNGVPIGSPGKQRAASVNGKSADHPSVTGETEADGSNGVADGAVVRARRRRATAGYGRRA